jgi:hypothetical protein
MPAKKLWEPIAIRRPSASGIVGWLLVVLGFCAPFVTMELVDADRGSAGYTAGSGFAIAIITIVITFVMARRMAKEHRGRAWLVGGAIVLAACLWSSLGINRGAIVYREYMASRPESERINRVAAAERALLNSGQFDPNQVSAEWRPYAAETEIRLSDAEIPLRARFVELTRRFRGRELALTRRLQEEIRAAGIDTALAADHLLDAQARVDSLDRIARYRRFIDSYNFRIGELEEKSEADMRSLQLPRTEEEEIFAAVKEGFKKNEPVLQAFMERERKYMDSIEAVIKFVEARAVSARLADGRVTFGDASDQREYEAMLARFTEIEGRQR